jgi:hypothetical protein
MNLSDCEGIMDIGIAALGRGCGQLQKIDFSGCRGITDIGVLKLCFGCCQLRTIDIRGCEGITGTCISAPPLKCLVLL